GSGLLNTWWALWLPYWAGGQIFGILLFRTFCEGIPESLFEAARIDGAGEFTIYTRIVLPLSLPIIATLAIIQFVGTYNDYVWPLVTISSPSNQVFAVGITQFAADAQLDMAPQMAGYIIGSIPLVIAFIFGMRYYVQGLTSGALKS
ncbi:MAG: carbohydrate ABC transporter permease, partial [Candidatus Sumerlaeia bacterium]|nr:carbohydrate ABC transporter permease [Candidatus Sumerlaeia bacterium]